MRVFRQTHGTATLQTGERPAASSVFSTIARVKERERERQMEGRREEGSQTQRAKYTEENRRRGKALKKRGKEQI